MRSWQDSIRIFENDLKARKKSRLPETLPDQLAQPVEEPKTDAIEKIFSMVQEYPDIDWISTKLVDTARTQLAALKGRKG